LEAYLEITESSRVNRPRKLAEKVHFVRHPRVEYFCSPAVSYIKPQKENIWKSLGEPKHENGNEIL
jgi:hypothetical protein